MQDITLDYGYYEERERVKEVIEDAVGIVIEKCKIPFFSPNEENYLLFYTANTPQGDELCQPLENNWTIYVKGTLILGIKNKRVVFGDFTVDGIQEETVKEVQRIEIRLDESYEYCLCVVTAKGEITCNPNDVAYIKIDNQDEKEVIK